MKSKKFRTLAAIFLSVIMLSTSLTAAFAAGTDSVNGTNAFVSWSTFPVQKRFSYNSGYTRALQTVLKYCDNGIYASRLGSVDGKFGEGTEAAVQMFQANNGIKVDGQVGPETWKALGSKLTSQYLAPLSEASLESVSIYEYYYIKTKVVNQNGSLVDANMWCFRMTYTTGAWAVARTPSTTGAPTTGWTEFCPGV